MEVDEAIQNLGLVGRWQITYYTLLHLTFLFPGCWHIFNIIWIGHRPPHHCKIPANSSIEDWIPRDKHGELSSCSIFLNRSMSNETTGCMHGWQYDDSFSGPTMAMKWDLVCDRGYLVDTSQTVMACGILVGSLIFTRISDHFGRKPIAIALQIGLNLIGFLTVFCERLEWYFVLRFFEGTFQQGMISCFVVQMCEMFSTKHRAMVAILSSALWGVAQCLLPLIAYLLKNWIHFQIFISLYGFLFIPAYWWLPETIPWLHANNKLKEAEDVLLRAASMNKMKLTRPIFKPYNYGEEEVKKLLKPVEVITPKHNNYNLKNSNEKSGKQSNNSNKFKTKFNLKNLFKKTKIHKENNGFQYSAMELVKNRRLLSFLVICILFGLVDNLVYYGLILSSHSLTSNHYLNGFINAFIEIPGCITLYLSVQKYGRKKPMAVSHTLAGIAMLGCVLAEIFLDKKYQTFLVPALSITGKFWISGAFATDIFYATEIFPTNLRNQAFGLCIFFSRLGTLMASYASYVAENFPSVLPLVFGILCILVAILVIFLPETRGKPLPETIEEIESWYKKDAKKGANAKVLVDSGETIEDVPKV